MGNCDAGPVPWALAGARTVHYGACLLAFGLAAFDRLAAAPVARRCQPALRPASASIGWGIFAALMAALASGAVWLTLVAADMSEQSPLEAVRSGAVAITWSQTQVGIAQHARLACLAVAALAVGLLPLCPARVKLREALIWTAFAGGAALVAGLAWSGHGADADGRLGAWHLPADLIHLLVTGLWPVGLLPLALSLRRLLRSGGPAQLDAAAAITRRFSILSLASVVALWATGLINAFCLVGSLHALLTSAYGRLLLLKVGLFIAMTLFGAVNLLYLKPRLEGATGRRAAGALRLNIAIELGLGTLIIAIVGLLGVLPPAM